MTERLGRARSGLRAGFLALLVAAALVLSACGGTGYHYVKSTENKTYFKVPEAWKLYDQETVLDALKGSLSDDEIAQRRDTMWTTVFDGSPAPSLNHLASSHPNYPLGQAVIRPLSPDASDSASLQSLRNIFFDVDEAVDAGSAHVSTYELVQFDGGFHGSHLVARVDGKNGSITLNQIAVLDQATSKVYAISIYCTTDCYGKNQSKIDKVMSSWTVKDS